ncbi:hypothetical protein R1sor_002232 [Riccia sorocarpa]|uniref:Telomeric single stranded DNA binding POT1/Cdc13 domain-containing protein n=1 Tax=Riccia sorocarpa TaxID=122646 RepID=A0ABD3GY78_9MARC
MVCAFRRKLSDNAAPDFPLCLRVVAFIAVDCGLFVLLLDFLALQGADSMPCSMGGPSISPRCGREHYEYLPLREAILREGEVNFYGAISEYEKPKPTRGSDFLCTMIVVDMSFDDPGLRLLVFAPVSSCPVVKSLGDIIRLHRVKVSNYKDVIEDH